ncbi:MAG: hypothetical protein COS94_02755 [Candidatus Hydrogenedentes bacterium CG07_land_8_20_14_0_80_42_17]|nr:MAG: hypothetical protein COS94_02755 [Candidatus Hydrogenedentes bacterium CG07_land_8_20_14_0_80_42_17]
MWRGKIQGLVQVVKYFTATAGTRPWAEVEDASCMRQGCHQTRLLEGRVTFHHKNIHFDHKPHLLEMKRGKKLRCTSCHSQMVMGSHISVTTSTCILCHFKDRPPGKPIAGCRGCHQVPQDTITLPSGLEYKHSKYVDSGVECISCHYSLTTGDGFVSKNRCFSCHNFDISKYLDKPEFLHQKHVTEHKVECMDCHEEITHGYESERRVARLDCNQCHSNAHSTVKILTEGNIAELIGDSRPHVGPMLSARVECIACHIKEIGTDTPHRGSKLIGSSEACVKCHGTRGSEILIKWRDYFENRIHEVERAIKNSRVDRNKLNRAKEFLAVVKTGNPDHNPSLARELLEAAENIANGKEFSVRRPIGDRATAGLDCRYCHLDAPQSPVKFQGISFPHRPHVRDAGLSCEKCHENAPTSFPTGRHGRIKLTVNDCQNCHHWQRGNCKGCHGSGPENAISWNRISFKHKVHIEKGIDCLKCHRRAGEGNRMGVSVSLSNCISCHHTVGNTKVCSKCHIGSRLPVTVNFRQVKVPHSMHVNDLGLECGDCHASSKQGVKLKPKCGDCHHESEMKPNCRACHGRGPSNSIRFKNVNFPHSTHLELGLECSDCHANGKSRIGEACMTCHEEDFFKSDNSADSVK